MDKQLYDPALRAAEKQHSRDRDQDDLGSGRISAADLHRRNNFFNGCDIVGAVIKDWKEFE